MRQAAIISTLLLCGLFQLAHSATVGDLREGAPDRYVVAPGDTLWSIAGRFLKDPWRWSELWKLNQDQIRNPHRIHPGDVLVLDKSAQELALRLLKTQTVVLSPRVRAEPLPPAPVPTIPIEAIQPFLTKPLVVSDAEYDAWPQIVANEENRLALGDGSLIHVKGLDAAKGTHWRIYRRGSALVDPETEAPLGTVARFLGEAQIVRTGEVTSLRITQATQEIFVGDRVAPAPPERGVEDFIPRAPAAKVRGAIVEIYNNVSQGGQYSVVALSKGSQDGLEVGHVLALRRNPATLDSLRSRPVYARPDPRDPAEYRTQPLATRDAPVYGRHGLGGGADTTLVVPLNELPDERYGLVMVFRTFERSAFALVMEATQGVNPRDIVTNP